jgi:predicted DNA binding CopG/RHH family protein
MIPKNVEEALDPFFRIDECADNKELQAWLTWTSSAIYQANINVANAKLDNEYAIEDHKGIYSREVTTQDGGITEKKIAAEINDEVVAAYKKVMDTKHKVRIAESLLEAIKEKAGCIRKIATLRSNTIQFNEGENSGNNQQMNQNSYIPLPGTQFSNFFQQSPTKFM